MNEFILVLGSAFFVILCVFIGVPAVAQSFVWWMRFFLKLREIRSRNQPRKEEST